MRIRRKLLGLVVLAGLAVLGYYFFTGPRMRIQPHVREYQLVMPPPPEGSVPLKNPLPSLPTVQQAQALNLPLASTAANLARGQVYYTYYCVFCHGPSGDGRGPVGDSYFPTPTDLRTARVQKMGDGELLRAMLTGVGHEPVLDRNVPQDDRWYLVLYVRHLAGQL